MSAVPPMQDPSPDLDRKAMARLARGDESAMDELMARHGVSLYTFLCRMVGDVSEARDLAQETFVRVYRARESFHAGAHFGSWVFTIAGNLARNHLRWRNRHPTSPFDAPEDNGERSIGERLPSPTQPPSEIAAETELHTAVHEAIDGLSPEMREAVLLVDVHGKSVREASGIARVPARTVESRLYHARRILRRRLCRWVGSEAEERPPDGHRAMETATRPGRWSLRRLWRDR